MTKCMWCDKERTIMMLIPMKFYVKGGVGITHPDVMAWEQYVDQEYIYACEDHRSNMENITPEEAEKIAIKDPNPMSLEQWLKTSDWFNGDDEEE